MKSLLTFAFIAATLAFGACSIGDEDENAVQDGNGQEQLPGGTEGDEPQDGNVPVSPDYSHAIQGRWWVCSVYDWEDYDWNDIDGYHREFVFNNDGTGHETEYHMELTGEKGETNITWTELTDKHRDFVYTAEADTILVKYSDCKMSYKVSFEDDVMTLYTEDRDDDYKYSRLERAGA